MARRRLLSGSRRRALFDIPIDATSVASHYTLSDEDPEFVHRRHGSANRLGLATQIALIRHPGFRLQLDTDVPDAVLHYRSYMGRHRAATGFEASLSATSAMFSVRVRHLMEVDWSGQSSWSETKPPSGWHML
ncbi:DUF4158 domain-containing protein [Novosphingobium resinovorum]|uniref:DUF4158 domain-containing protein n=1 Tax=Novosphingobium resinovorum TaxID=158500 RepID=UPI002ED01E19|nr:DUF4158 domain-containing protein [Novosphingobium resinovorum]